MDTLFPHAMFVTRRALCPNCGAPIPIAEADAQVTCAYCGSVAVVERRLRENEPEEKPEQRKVPVEWTPSHLNPGQTEERATCWACGAQLVFAGNQFVVKCPQCSCESKIERRMKRVAPPLEAGDDDRGTASLFRQLRESKDLAEQVSLAREAFNSWHHVNDTAARRIGEIMELLETADPRVAHAAGEIVGKLLCEDKKVLYVDAVLRAAEKHLFHPNVSRVLLWQIGLGPGVCMKPLLDSADVLWKNGDLVRASTALWAANTLLGRNYPDHPTIGQIVLYRMLYLHGPVLGWALNFAQGQGGTGFRYPTATLLQFVDDCAAERPSLVPEIRRAIYDTNLDNEKDYQSRLELYRTLQTPEAKETLLRTLPPPPKGTSLRGMKAAHDLIFAALDDPRLSAAASHALVRQMEEGVPAAIHNLIKAKKDALPEDLRRAYLKKVPDSPHLSKLPVKYWESEKPVPKAPEIEEAERLYKEGISQAVDLWNEEAEALRHYGQTIENRTPLMMAAGRGDAAEIEKLRAGSDVNETNDFGRTALMFAAEGGHAAAIAALQADPTARDRDGKTAIVLATEAGHVEAVRALLGDASLAQEAFRAAFAGKRVAIMKVLLEGGCDPDALEEDGSTPLMACAKHGWRDLATVLLDAQAQFDHQDNNGKSALMHAAEGGCVEMVALLLERGANADGALEPAAKEGHAKIVELIAPRVADINAKGSEGKSALAWAEENGHAEVVRVLKGRGASVAADTTLLLEAVEKKDAARVRELLDAGMTPDVEKDGYSVLYKSINRSNPEIFNLLLERGAKVGARVLSRLVVVYSLEGLKAALARGADVNARDDRGETALFVAASKGYLDVAQLLLSHGADPKLRDGQGHGVLFAANIRRDNQAMMDLLRGAGADA